MSKRSVPEQSSRAAAARRRLHELHEGAELSPFGEALAELLPDSPYETPTELARDARLNPTTISRARYKDGPRPTLQTLTVLEELLGVEPGELISVVYRDEKPAAFTRKTHPLVSELGKMLADDSPLPDEKRELLYAMVDHLIEPYRRYLRPGRKRAS